jgi:uncharacterized protein (TIGR02466 family)
MPTSELLSLFPTPVLVRHWPDSDELNARLRELILRERQRSEGDARTVVETGWQSEHDAPIGWNDPSVSILLDRIKIMVQELVSRTTPQPQPDHLDNWTMTIWCNVNPPGGGHRGHQHYSETLWAGVYYVDVGETDGGRPKGGRLVFEDHSGVPKEILVNANPFEREVAIEPRAGMMLLFPGLLFHRVEPFTGVGYRLSMAFNLRHRGFVNPIYPDRIRRKSRVTTYARHVRRVLLAARLMRPKTGM